MKFEHKFKLEKSDKTYRLYKSGHINSRINFVSESCIRVAIYKKEADLLPTFCINPTNDHSLNGRKRLSTDGFKLYSPAVSVKNDYETFELGKNIQVTLDLNNFLLTYTKNGTKLFA